MVIWIQDNLKDRARQNVVFEHGFLNGKLGRKNVCAFVKGNIETQVKATKGMWDYIKETFGYIANVVKDMIIEEIARNTPQIKNNIWEMIKKSK